MLSSRPIKRLRNGHYQLKLSEKERDVLKTLPGGLRDQLAAGQDDGSMMRLFPSAYTADLGRQVEYDRLMRDELTASHLNALKTMEQTAEADVLTEEQLDDWLRALNQLRLVLGTRLDITEETTEDTFGPDDPRVGGFALYVFLGYLQEEATEAMSSGL